MKVRRVLAALLLTAAAAARPLPAQLWQLTGGDAGLARINFHATGLNGNEALKGLAAGLQGRLLLHRFWLEAAYTQGRLSADGVAAAPRDLVDGTLFAAIQPRPWLTIKTGPRLRAYVAPAADEHWAMWEVHARAGGPAIFGSVRGYAELWFALASSVNTDQGSGGAGGGEAGITFQVPLTRLRGRLVYAVDQAKMKSGTRSETLESVSLSVGLGVH